MWYTNVRTLLLAMYETCDMFITIYKRLHLFQLHMYNEESLHSGLGGDTTTYRRTDRRATGHDL